MRCVLNQKYLLFFRSEFTGADSLEYLGKAKCNVRNVAASVKSELINILLLYSLICLRLNELFSVCE